MNIKQENLGLYQYNIIWLINLPILTIYDVYQRLINIKVSKYPATKKMLAMKTVTQLS